jgi:tetratricopeptide (TPR) repeat protein
VIVFEITLRLGTMAPEDDSRLGDPLAGYFRRVMKDPGIPQSTKHDLQIMMASHLTKGEVLRFQGLLREALAELEREKDRAIQAPIDAEIVEAAFWQMGDVYRQLGEMDEAIAAYEKAMELFRQYGVGVGPHEDLAELYLERQRIDEAIALCQEALEEVSSWRAKQILSRAMALKEGIF